MDGSGRRGDLGVEIDIARVVVVQKEIISLCARWHKPMIIATQMLVVHEVE